MITFNVTTNTDKLHVEIDDTGKVRFTIRNNNLSPVHTELGGSESLAIIEAFGDFTDALKQIFTFHQARVN